MSSWARVQQRIRQVEDKVQTETGMSVCDPFTLKFESFSRARSPRNPTTSAESTWNPKDRTGPPVTRGLSVN